MQKAERQEECNFLKLDEFVGSVSLFQAFEIECIPLTALLFQMGYLTIDGYDTESRIYTLRYPNLEVKTALHKHLLVVLTKVSYAPFDSLIGKLFTALRQVDMEGLMMCFGQLFSKIPYQIQEDKEKFYHAVIQALFIASNIPSHAEYSTQLGRADIIVDFSSGVFVFEIKCNKTAETALEQIEDRKYYEPFLGKNKPVYAVGVAFRGKKSTKKQAGLLTITYAFKKIA